MKIRIDAKSTHVAVIVMQRSFAAPRERIWSALTDPKQVARWYGGTSDEAPLCEMDVRPGGRWHFVTKTPDGVERSSDYEFGDVVENEKLTWKDANVRMTVTLEPAGHETKWKLVARFNTYAERDAAAKAGFAKALAEGTERLHALITGSPAPAA